MNVLSELSVHLQTIIDKIAGFGYETDASIHFMEGMLRY